MTMNAAARRVAAGYAALSAAVVGVTFVLSPLFGDGSGFPVAWNTLNWFMAPSVLVAVGASLAWKLRPAAGGGDAGEARRLLEANVRFYAAAILGLWFFWNWFGDLMSREEVLLWAFIDPLFVVVVGACGVRLWREPEGAA